MILSSRSIISWFATVAPTTVLATAKVDLDSFAWGSNTEDSNIEKRRVNESFESCWKSDGGREMEMSGSSSEEVLAGPDSAERSPGSDIPKCTACCNKPLKHNYIIFSLLYVYSPLVPGVTVNFTPSFFSFVPFS